MGVLEILMLDTFIIYVHPCSRERGCALCGRARVREYICQAEKHAQLAAVAPAAEAQGCNRGGSGYRRRLVCQAALKAPRLRSAALLQLLSETEILA